jgi:hypothetical protein
MPFVPDLATILRDGRSMRLRSSIALALIGWYLMVPPLSLHGSSAVDINAPLSNWHIFQSFDSVSECEALRQRITQGEKGTPYYQAILTSACIASDDPRLKKK